MPNEDAITRVAIVCGAGIVSGKEIMALELGQGVRDVGLQVEYLTSAWGNGDFGRRTAALGFATHRLRLGFISATRSLAAMGMTAHQMLYWPELLRSFRNFVRQFRPRCVIHTNWHHLLLLWPLLQPRRDVYWVHEVIPDKQQYRRVFSFLGGRLGRFVAVSEAVRESLRRIDIPGAQIELIYNGIADPRPLNSSPQASGKRIGVIGQIGAWKGHEDLLRAFAQAAISHPTAELQIFGKGERSYEQFLRTLALQLGLSRQLVWHGFAADRAYIYQLVDIVAVPSRCVESFGLTALEAAFFEIPVVAARAGGLQEIVRDGITGHLFEPGNIFELSQKIGALLDAPERALDMGREARALALRSFTRERLAERFLQLIDNTAVLERW